MKTIFDQAKTAWSKWLNNEKSSHPTGDFSLPPSYLPNFCEGQMVFSVVLITELVAFIYTFTQKVSGEIFWQTLARSSVFLLWLGLVTAALLCVVRKVMRHRGESVTTMVALSVIVATTYGVSHAALALGRYYDQAQGGVAAVANSHAQVFLIQNLLVGTIIGALTLRYFYVAHQWRQNLEAQSLARVQALQARIRPHFLFNSMNTIASLIRTSPELAEGAVEDLADLFRASLSDSKTQVTLGEEIAMAQMYQRIEMLRMGDRLQVDWQLAALPMEAKLPGLVLQPLIENAIYHGVETLPDGGTVRIHGSVKEDLAIIHIHNRKSKHNHLPRRSGNHMALANITERLALAFGKRASLSVVDEEETFEVTMAFPIVEKE